MILVRPGTYTGRVRLRGIFPLGVEVRSEIPYQARLRHSDTVVTCFNGEGITLAGFDIAHTGPGAGGLVIQIQDLIGEPGGVDFVSRITLRDNVIHDSYNNDLVKVNNGAGNITVEGNLFYNQTGHDEHIDANSVTDVVIQDNVFFNDFQGSGRTNRNDTGSFIVIKDSNGADDTNLGSERVTVRRNVFLNWEGTTGTYFVLIGEDGMPFYEARQVLVENNLMIGNSTNVMRAAFGVKGGKDVTFRFNTVVGDLPALAYAMRLNTEGANLPNDGITLVNNIWSDPTGTMGAENPTRPNDFSDTPPAETLGFLLDSNLYWNGGEIIPSNGAELVNYTDDVRRIVDDPLLRDPAGVVLPRYVPATGRFADGSTRIRETLENLVRRYASVDPGSPAIDAASGPSPATDILSNPRPSGSASDIGAWERQSAALVFSLSVSRSGTGGGTLTSAPSGIQCGADCSESYPEGTSVTLIATPSSGSTFAGWSGDCTGTGACVMTMSADRSATAGFTALGSRTLSVTPSGGGSGMIVSDPAGILCGGDCSASYPHGTDVTLRAVPVNGSSFLEWTGACSGAGECVLSMTGALAVGATFAPGVPHASTYRVTIENLTAGQALTPPVLVTHKGSLRVYRPRRRASSELQALAENGDSGGLLTSLAADRGVSDVVLAGGGPLVPGNDPATTLRPSSASVVIGADRRTPFVSMASMLICTNDGFAGLSRVRLPRSGTRVLFPGVYDGGTEVNTEDFADLVPGCQSLIGVTSADAGSELSEPALAEGGRVSRHRGVVGGNDLLPLLHGWAGPVARVTITALRPTARRFVAQLRGNRVVSFGDDGNRTFVDSVARGAATFRLLSDDQALSFILKVRRIVDVTDAELRVGLPDENGPVVATLYGPAPITGRRNGRLARGTLTEADLVGPFVGNFAGFLTALRNGELYLSVGTTTYPEGEIRGQIGGR